jgi:hypothetical protein
VIRFPTEKERRLDFLQQDSLSRSLSGLVKVVWPHIYKYYGTEIELPPIKVAFMPDETFFEFLKHADSSKLTKAEYGREEDVLESHMLYIGRGSFNDGEFQVIAVRKSKLQRARRFLIRILQQHFTTPEFLVIGLIHETIHLYEALTGTTVLNHSETPVTEAEKTIFMSVKRDDPEFFFKKNEIKIRKLLDKIPDE